MQKCNSTKNDELYSYVQLLFMDTVYRAVM